MALLTSDGEDVLMPGGDDSSSTMELPKSFWALDAMFNATVSSGTYPVCAWAFRLSSEACNSKYLSFGWLSRVLVELLLYRTKKPDPLAQAWATVKL